MTSSSVPSRRIAAFIVLFLVAAILLVTQALAGAIKLTREEEQALASVNTISRAFTGVAKIIRPAVVNIQVERQIRSTGIRYNDPLGFFDGLLPGFPGMPEFPGMNGRRPQVQAQIGLGSGVIVDSRGYILTNNHVVGGADAIRVSLLDGREFPADLIGADPRSDVAVIKIDADNLTVATIGDSDSIEVGEWVLAVGNPFGLDFTVTSGIISARGRTGMDMLAVEDFIQTDASINPGNSGGPLVNLKGEVIGINTFIFTPDNTPGRSGSVGVGFAIPSNMAKSIMQSLITHKQVTSSYLGAETQPLTQDLAEAFGMKSPKGALVQMVTKGSPAERAGLRRGDVVVRWGKRDIDSDLQFRNLVVVTTPGEPVDAEVIRDGRTVILRVVLDATAPEVILKGRSDRFLQAIGIEVADLTPEIREELGYEANLTGVLVTSAGIDARQINLHPGSVISSINGVDIKDMQDLRTVLGNSERTKNYKLLWRYRNITIGVNLILD